MLRGTVGLRVTTLMLSLVMGLDVCSLSLPVIMYSFGKGHVRFHRCLCNYCV